MLFPTMLDPEVLGPERVRPLYRREYERLAELGFFQDQHVELLRGALVEMSPQGPAHAEVTQRLLEHLLVSLQGRARVRAHSPVAALDDSEPEPDIAVVPDGDYSAGHPTRAHLVVEVAATSARKDRELKARIYAEAGYPECWIVDLTAGEVVILTEPRGGEYKSAVAARSGDTVAPRAFPDVQIAVADILP